MPAPLSPDLRQRIAEALDQHKASQAAIARRFGVGKATVERLARLHKTTGSIAPRPHAGGLPPIVPTEHYPVLKQWLEHTPDLTQADLAQRYQDTYNQAVSARTMGRVLKRMEQTRKKSPCEPHKPSAPM